MIIFLYGPDDYRRIQKKKEIIAEFGKKHSGLGLAVFDLEEEEGSPDKFVEFARNQSIFESAKLAVLENAFEMEAEKLAKFLKPLVAEKTTTILLCESGKPLKALAFLLEKPSLSQKFENLEGAGWMSFINGEAKKCGVKLAAAAAQFLGMVYQGSSWALVTELQKLSSFNAGSGAGKTIEKNDLDFLDLEAAPNYWALLNGLKNYDPRIRLSTLEKLFSINDPAPKIFNILAAQAGEKIPRMAEYDLAVKSGKLDYEEVLLDLAIG
jgi:DNA polymerase III delta subunit